MFVFVCAYVCACVYGKIFFKLMDILRQQYLLRHFSYRILTFLQTFFNLKNP